MSRLKHLRYGFVLGLILLIILSAAGGYVLFFGEYTYFLFLLVPATLYIARRLYLARFTAFSELADFSEAVRYRDFTRTYPPTASDAEIQALRATFNQINGVFKEIRSEAEIQYQYLQSLLDIVDTGIISYEINSGKVVWMNESFKKLFSIPYLPTFDGLQKRHPELYSKTQDALPGAATIFSLTSSGRQLKLLLHTRDFRTAEGAFRMVSYQNVNDAIDKTEAQAWQKLLSVLTHEIMNSIAPISSLAETLSVRLRQRDASTHTDDIKLGIDTIRRRSDGLLKFAQTYRSLNTITRLNLRQTLVAELFENIYQLFEPTLIQRNIELDIILKDPGLHYEMDSSLIEQVLINLVLNAIEAVKDTSNPYISLSAQLTDNRLFIEVKDNGKGIPSDLLDTIFIPFFTTRKTGSGVGLTLAKKIMLLHGGNMLVTSVENEGSTFVLTF